MGVQTPSTKREATKSDKEDNSNNSWLLEESKEMQKHSPTPTPIQATCHGKTQKEDYNKFSKKTNSFQFLASQKPDIRAQSSILSPSTSLSSVYLHIHVLYAFTFCLILMFASAGIVCFFQISALKQDLSDHKITISKLVFDIHAPLQHDADTAMFTPYNPSFNGDDLKFQENWDAGVRGYEEVMTSGGKRSKRQATRGPEHQHSVEVVQDNTKLLGKKVAAKKDSQDEWLWMSAYTRVPRSREGMMVALKSYCREAQLYCAAGGKPGTPGPKGEDGKPGFSGDKGSKGERGDKGDSLDESAIAQNLASGIGVQGPPGPKGNRGDRGYPGEMGMIGRDGKPGDPGLDGIDGTQGPRGAKGEPGKRGLLGFPGRKGEPGPIGPRGPKGDRGQRGVEGLGGSKGERGYKGSRGERGISGMPGVPGMKGRSGRPGNPGPVGHKGVMGMKGSTGHCKIECLDTRKPTTASTTTTTTPQPFPPRKKECSIKKIGKPVYLRSTPSHKLGAFMTDSNPEGSAWRVWMTLGITGLKLREYSNMRDFSKNKVYRILDLNGVPYFGTGHIIHKGCFYYHQANSPYIVRYNLTMAQSTTVREVKDAIYHSDTTHKSFLYQSKTTFFDFNVDSNGLWVVYGNKKSMKLVVAMYELRYLDVIKSVEIDISQGSKGNAFIICGRLFTVDHYNRRHAKIDIEYDVWSGKQIKRNIYFGNPFGSTTMLKYDSRQNKLLMWDSNVQLSVPLLL